MANPGWSAEPRVPGQRRQKVFGYLKAANELRQSYQQSLSTRWQEGDYQEGIPGAFPDTDVVRSGDEEMLLFPSYARRHTKATHASQSDHPSAHPSAPGARDGLSNPNPRDEDYWRREWQRYEDENAIVDVDVRGWVYTPQRGPLNRRNRLLLAVARRLSGLPPPDNSPSHSRESSQGPTWRNRAHDDMLSQEEEAAAREAELIARRGQREADAAREGRYTVDNDSLLDFSPANSRSSSPSRSSDLPSTDAGSLSAVQKRRSWNSSTQMTREEAATANEQLMTRLRPFMSMPTGNTPITIFFYNDNKSQSKSVYTDESGHFKVRAALDFVPNKVRVLASETLSATEDVVVTDSHGISLVSDIDDTIKHSAIASGAKEIFKNTFIRELGELTVPGVKEWYCKMADLGVKIHYVSNSPWQLYPLLRSYFSLAGLPPGSFHLKQYTGMLQGIFEPAAERKKGSLDRIMHDFPERKFILIGDSGEADLEVYSDIVQEHPGRVLGVFIRDVTSKEENNLKDFFHAGHSADAKRGSRTADKKPEEERGPKLPQRPRPVETQSADLINFSDEVTTPKNPRSLHATDLQELQNNDKSTVPRPERPAKPSNLRSMSTMSPPPPSRNAEERPISRQNNEGDVKKSTPPPPPAPRRTLTSTSTISNVSAHTTDGERYYAQYKQAPPPPPPPSHARRDSRTLWQESSHYDPRTDTATSNTATGPSYLATARNQLSNAYNALPSLPLRSQTSNPSLSTSDDPSLPPRRGISSYPAAAARFVTGATGGDPAAGGDGGAPGQPYDRKLEMWKRRWIRAEEIMRRHGVILRTWRNGTDVMDLSLRLAEKEMDRHENGARNAK